jgi:Protein of unknown function (DUF3667)
MEFKISDVKAPVQIHTCRNCKHSFTGKICNQCGEKVFDEKQLTSKHFFHQVIDFFWHWENKVLKTIKLNFLKPGFITKQNLNGIRVPYAKPVQLYLVVAVIFYLVVTKVGVTDYIPYYGDHKYFPLSGYRTFGWAAPLDNAVENSIDSMWVEKGREMQAAITEEIQPNIGTDGSLKIIGRGKTDSMYIPAGKIPVYTFNEMKAARWDMFQNKVGPLGKTLIFILLPFFAGFFFLFFFKKLKYYGAALILATHFMVYNLCIYALNSLISIWPGTIIKGAKGWLTKPLEWIFYNQYTEAISGFIFGGWFEFIHLLFWMPWFLIAFKRLFNTVWWKNILISYCYSRVFFFLIFGALKKLLIAFTIWTMH